VARLGSKTHPVVVRVHSEKKALAAHAACREFDLHCIVRVEPERPEDLSDLERALDPPGYHRGRPKSRRNAPCPCGSGKKSKKCCKGLALRAAMG
jgi:SWIM/SEC-C metal-binding protein